MRYYILINIMVDFSKVGKTQFSHTAGGALVNIRIKKLFTCSLILSLLLVSCKSGDLTDTYPTAETSEPDRQDSENANQDIPYEFTRKHNIYKEAKDYGFTLLSLSGIEKSDGVLMRGIEVGVNVHITNLTNNSIMINGDKSVGISVKLVCKTYDESLQRHIDEYVINRTFYVVSGDVSSVYEWAHGETIPTSFYYFTIPEHAIPGSYSLVCSYNGSTVEFENVFTLD